MATRPAKEWQEAQTEKEKQATASIFVRQEEGVQFTLGPKITDWDEQRASYLEKFPGSNVTSQGKPRVLLLSASQPRMCENPYGDHFLLRSMKNKLDYSTRHGLEFSYGLSVLNPEMTGFWTKLPLFRHMLLSHPEVEWIWWMDADAVLTDMLFEVPLGEYVNHNLVLHGWENAVYNEKNWVGLNTGSFFMRNCQWVLDLLDEWAKFGPKNARVPSGKLLTKDLYGRPDFESDDQSALIWLLINQKEKWASKTYLESNYFLHGYWMILVDKYEDLIEKHHPGRGDERWPLVTHFVGCKPCGLLNEADQIDFKMCKHGMERAFNFAENQILQPFGYEHLHLNTTIVRPVDIENPISEAAKVSLERMRSLEEEKSKVEEPEEG